MTLSIIHIDNDCYLCCFFILQLICDFHYNSDFCSLGCHQDQ